MMAAVKTPTLVYEANSSSLLQVAGFLDHSTVNGEGFRSVLFLSGCPHYCPGCHNEIMQHYDYGESIKISDIISRIIKNASLIDGVTLSGGEPFEQSKALLPLLKCLKNMPFSIWAYTGYTYEALINYPDKARLLAYIDVLVDGPYIESLRDDHLKFCGSSNQRILKLYHGEIQQELTY